MSTPDVIRDTTQPDSHYLLLHSAIPTWLGTASSAKRQALSRVKPKPLSAGPVQYAALKRLNAAHWTAQNAVDDALRQVQDPRTYARTLLEDELRTRFGQQLDSEAVYLRLYIPLSVPWFSIPTGAARTWTVSLVDAALHNFEHSETVEGAFERESTYTTRPNDLGQFDTLPAIREKISIRAFTRLCRELDIGARYQRYLREQLGLTEAVAQAVLQHKVNTSQRAALAAALQLARTLGDIQQDFAQQVEHLLQGRSDLRLGNRPLKCHALRIMDAPLTGILLLAADLETTGSAQRLVAYVPDDPLHPLKEYTSPLAFKQELTRQLRDADYQAFFSRFVAHEQRGPFFANLSQRLARITWHPPQYGSALAPWRKQPTDDPKLQFEATPIQGDPWVYLYQRKLDKILNDALTQAVPTAEVDRKARWALWDSFVNVASSILNAALLVVAPFVPGLGELMLGYMAYQLLDDVFEGIVDWAEGMAEEAFGHLLSVTESLLQLGGFAVGSTIGVALLRTALPQDVLAFIDRFKPVTLSNGSKRYWKPDLAPYQQAITLPPRLGINSLGLHSLRGESMLPLEGQLYAVQALADGERHVIKHPTRPDAYTPRLQHNGAGAWHSELDHPLEWDRSTLLRRLGHPADTLSEADRELALTLSGVDDHALRRMHTLGEPLPPLLADTLERLRIDRELQTLIDRLNSDDPALYNRVEPQAMLQLLALYGDWPKTRALRILDAQGNVAWEYGDMRTPVVQIHEAQLANGELLKTLLQTLTPEEIRAQFGERAADPQLSLEHRAMQLRKKLARQAQVHRAELFDSRYGLFQPTSDAPAQQLKHSAPGLANSVIARLRDQASAAELNELGDQRTPPRLADLAQTALNEQRLNRAYEGQYLRSTPSLDSDRLALNALKIQPGWSANLRLEARHLKIDGEVWLRVGAADAALVRNLVRTASGRYVPYNGTVALAGESDLYTAILRALPDAQRKALGIDIHQGPALQQRLRQRPLPRAELRQVLDTQVIRPPGQETLRLLGSDTGYPIQAAPAHTLHARAHTLYPTFDNEQIRRLLDRLDSQPGGATNGLAALADEYRQLSSDLHDWQQQALTTHPDTHQPLSLSERRDERQNRRVIASQLRSCWRREGEIDDYFDDPNLNGQSLRLDYPTLGGLPQLTANFDHVSLLTLSGHPNTPRANAFVQGFRRLRHLTINGFNLGTVPEAVFALPRLNSLSLSGCNISLNATSQARIATLRNLQTLVLHGNPLGVAPSVEAMPHLIHLDLSKTAIEQLPAGALTRPELQVALLNDNRLRELPADFFTLEPSKSSAFFLSDNPFSLATVKHIKAYYQRHGTAFEADALAADVRDARLLYPSLSEVALNRLIYNLPGTVEAGQIELARRAGELATLQDQLSQWAQAPGVSPTELARRNVLRQLFESSWRREVTDGSTQLHSLIIPRDMIGELPTLNATFKHIRWLIVRGNDTPVAIDRFLGHFPELQAISLNQLRLGDVPPEIFSLPKLTHLDLENCAIRLSPNSLARLERMSALTHLNLSNNPLGAPPDFSQLRNLTVLHMRNTGLNAVPSGLLAHVQRETIDLSGNAIEALPPGMLALPAPIGQAFDLSANPLSRQALEHVKSYCQHSDEFFNVQSPAAQRSRARQLFPALSDRELNRLIFGLPGNLDNIDGALTAMAADYQQLVADLQHWVDDIPAQHPAVGGVLPDYIRTEEELNRNRFKRLLEQAWRRESPLDEESLDDRATHAVVLDAPIIGAMPVLRANFEHVTALDIRGAFTITDINGTLGTFTALQTLVVSHCNLGELPPALFTLRQLSTLDLTHCEVKFTPATAGAVGDLHNLEYLDLGYNPLGHAPDVSNLQQLSSLHLPRTQISEVPTGVFQLSELQNLDLSNNQIKELPADLIEVRQVFDEDSDLRGNPWSLRSLRLLRTYYVQTGIDFQLHEITVDGNGDPLLPVSEDEAMEE